MNVMVCRGGLLETRHRVRAVAVRYDASHTEQIVYTSGEALHSMWRSAGKHLQAWTSLELLGDPDLSVEEIATAVSSHSGEPGQVALVRRLLSRFGLDESALRCGAEAPIHQASRDALVRDGAPPLAVHNDCSGKHALMLGACVNMGWSLDYLDVSHPLQQRILRDVSDWTGEHPQTAIDGCGVPTFHLSVTAMARSWARMATAVADGAFRDRPDQRMRRIGQAAMAHPELTSGVGRLDLAVAERAREPYFGKIGAQGVFCLALPERRMGIAMKVVSGNEDALAVAIPSVMVECAPGSLRPAADWRWAHVRNVAGRKVGSRVATNANRV